MGARRRQEGEVPGRAGNVFFPWVLSNPPGVGVGGRTLGLSPQGAHCTPLQHTPLLLFPPPHLPCQPVHLNSSFKTNLAFLTFSVTPSGRSGRDPISPSPAGSHVCGPVLSVHKGSLWASLGAAAARSQCAGQPVLLHLALWSGGRSTLTMILGGCSVILLQMRSETSSVTPSILT